MNEKPSFCSACKIGKAHTLPFPLSQSHTLQPLELIYSDL